MQTSAISSSNDEEGGSDLGPRRRLRRSSVVGLALGVVILAVLIWRSNAEASVSAVRSAQPGLLVVALLLNAPVVLLRTLRANLVLRALGHSVPYMRMLLVQLVGQTASSMTPAAGGDLVRAYLWRRDDEVPATTGVVAVAFERIYSFALLAAVGTTLVLTLAGAVVGTVAGCLVILAVLLFPRVVLHVRTDALSAWVHRADRVRLVSVLTHVERGLEGARNLAQSPLFLVRFAAVTAVLFLLNGAQLWLLLRALGSPVSLLDAVGVFAASQTGATLSTLPFGLGTMEVVMAAFLVRAGLHAGNAATAALLLRFVTTIPLALAAIVAYLWMERERHRELFEPPLATSADAADADPDDRRPEGMKTGIA